MPDSEFRLYGYITRLLVESGWDIRPPQRGGQVYAQNEALRDEGLKAALGQGRPEYVVKLGSGEYWVIEAKSDLRDLPAAIEQAEGRADLINRQGLSCRIITGVAGSPDTTHYIETRVLVAGSWKPLILNNRESTGFVSPSQVAAILSNGNELLEYDIAESLFNEKVTKINQVLHQGGINKRNRAGVLASLLLALAKDERMRISDSAMTLIRDINSRAEQVLREHNKGPFFDAIRIDEPTSADNHIKHRIALTKTVEMLRDLNIASAINSGRDVLGQFYEQFLKYANDAKELGIVLTPRHITNFAAEIVNVRRDDKVFDPACGTGGFLVAALDKVRKTGGDVTNFKLGNLYGVDNDKLCAALAIVNMIFRGDGSSNIFEGDCFAHHVTMAPDKVLMNPPFALDEQEWKFVDRALGIINQDGLLFSVLPTSSVGSPQDGRGEITWRKEMLRRHTLIAVVKLPEDLFYPHVSKGTVGIVIKANKPHDIDNDKVVWAILRDGITRTKTKRSLDMGNSNMSRIAQAIGNYLSTQTLPTDVPMELRCCAIADLGGPEIDLSPENYIDSGASDIDVSFVVRNIEEEQRRIAQSSARASMPSSQVFRLMEFVGSAERGKSGRKKELPDGGLPLISTSERANGISAMVDPEAVSKIYPVNAITVSSNGGSCCAFYHGDEFAANSDVFVLTLKDEYENRDFAIFLCAAINAEKWRFGYFRKFSETQLRKLTVKMPVTEDGAIDFQEISRIVGGS